MRRLLDKYVLLSMIPLIFVSVFAAAFTFFPSVSFARVPTESEGAHLNGDPRQPLVGVITVFCSQSDAEAAGAARAAPNFWGSGTSPYNCWNYIRYKSGNVGVYTYWYPNQSGDVSGYCCDDYSIAGCSADGCPDNCSPSTFFLSVSGPGHVSGNACGEEADCRSGDDFSESEEGVCGCPVTLTACPDYPGGQVEWTCTDNCTVSGYSVTCAVGDDDGGETGSCTAVFDDRPVTEKDFGQTCPSAGDPVNFSTGNKYETETDIMLSGPGLPMRYVRTYNSRNETDGMQGWGWTGSFSESLSPESGRIILTEADARQVWFFDEDADGTFVSETGEIRKITENTVTGEYILAEPDGRKLTFDSAGNLRQISGRSGNTQTVANSGGKPVSVTDSFGRQFTFSYNAEGKLGTLVTPIGNFSYAYDTSGNLIKVTKPDTAFREYRYEDTADPHNMTGITDENTVRYATFAYDSEDRAVSSVIAGAAKGTEITYPDSMADPSRTVSDSLSNEKVFTLIVRKGIGKVLESSGSGCSTCPFASGNTVTYTADRFQPETVTDAEGNITRYTHDTRGNVVTVTEAAGTPQERVTSFTWHTDYNFPLTVTRPSVSGGTVTDQYSYDAKGNLLTLRENSGTPAERITAFSWDSHGRMTGIDGPRTDVNDTVTLGYYPAASGGWLQSITDAMNSVTIFSDYNSFGKPGRITDANSVITDFVYDTMGRMISKTVAGISTGYVYDNTGKLTKITLPGSREITYEYTDAGRLEKITDNSGNYILYAYDTEGNRKKEEIHGSAGTLKSYTDYAYDEHNRLSQILYAGSSGETFGYDGNNSLTSFTDGNGKIYAYACDALRRMTGVTKPGNITETAEYDPADNLKKITDARSSATVHTYDDAGNMTGVNSPDSGTAAYTYDRAGNMTSRTDAENITVTYDYDALNRLTDIHFPDSSQNISYTYDTGTYGIGKLSAVTDPSGSTAFVYNDLGQITQETRTADSLTFETVYGYDASTADLNAVTYPTGTVLTYQRDADGRISGISADGQSIVSNITYQPFGPVSTMTLGGLSVIRSFDQRYQVSGIAAGTVMNRTYTYDGAGNVRTISGITKPPIAPGTTDYSIPSGNSRVSGSTGKTVKTYSHDNAGKITSDGVRTFTYNQNSQLIRVTAGASVIAEYAYDGFSRRVKKTAEGRTVLYHYDYDGNLISETDGAGNPIRDYVYLNSEPAAMKIYGNSAGWYFFLNDHLGTPQKVVDASGTVVWEAGYMPFGEARVLVADIENNLRFPGQYFDAETGLHYNWHRYYDPDTGKYLTPDPIGLDGGMNLYVYVDGNPVNWVDSNGLDSEQAYQHTQWYIDHSGLKNLPQIAENAVMVLVTAESFIWSEAVINAALGNFLVKSSKLCQPYDKTDEFVNLIDNFFGGEKPRIITNKSNDKILLTGDKKIRFDFQNSHGDNPHVHFEIFKNGKWKDAFNQHRFYPKN